MAGGSTAVPTSLEQGISTIWTLWLTGGCSTFDLAMSPPNPSSYDQEGEPCVPPPGETGSPVSLLSSTIAIGGGIIRVTSDPTSIIATGITTNYCDGGMVGGSTLVPTSPE